MSTQPEKDGSVEVTTTALNDLTLSEHEGTELYDGLKKARVDWTQDEESITLIVNISDLKEYDARTEGGNRISTIFFKSKFPKGYGFRLQLLGKVLELKPANVKLLGQSLRMKLNKLSPGYRWPYLTAANVNLHWLKPLATNEIKLDEEDDVSKLGTLTRYVTNLLASTDDNEGNETGLKLGYIIYLGGGGESSSEEDYYYCTDEEEES